MSSASVTAITLVDYLTTGGTYSLPFCSALRFLYSKASHFTFSAYFLSTTTFIVFMLRSSVALSYFVNVISLLIDFI
jgi:hypothetical protein